MRQLLTLHVQSGSRDECRCSAPFLFFHTVWDLRHGIVLLIFRVGRPTSINSIQKTPRRHPEACFLVVLDPVKLTTVNNQHSPNPFLTLGLKNVESKTQT